MKKVQINDHKKTDTDFLIAWCARGPAGSRSGDEDEQQ